MSDTIENKCIVFNLKKGFLKAPILKGQGTC